MQTGVITIGTNSWQVQVATTTAEIAQGLKGVQVPLGTGMLFDLGAEQSSVSITMDGVLVNLGLVFISNSLVMVGYGTLNTGSGNTVIQFPAGQQPRYFLEINALDFPLVTWMDPISITGWTPPAPSTPLDMTALMGMMVQMMIVIMMMKMMSGMMTKELK